MTCSSDASLDFLSELLILTVQSCWKPYLTVLYGFTPCAHPATTTTTTTTTRAHTPPADVRCVHPSRAHRRRPIRPLVDSIETVQRCANAPRAPRVRCLPIASCMCSLRVAACRRRAALRAGHRDRPPGPRRSQWATSTPRRGRCPCPPAGCPCLPTRPGVASRRDFGSERALTHFFRRVRAHLR